MPAPEPLRRLKNLHDERPLLFWATIVLGASVVLAVGAVAFPELVVEQFIWKNFWGPTEADANQVGRATRFDITVTEDYTLTSELVYGIILAGALYSIYVHLFQRAGLVCDGRFILALTPYILFGPVGRVLEDADVFCRAGTAAGTGCSQGLFSYPFISPIIYLFIAAIVVVHMLVMRRAAHMEPGQRRLVVGAMLAGQVGVYGFVVTAFAAEFTHILAPWVAALVGAGSFAVYEMAERRGWEPFRSGLFALGLPLVVGPFLMAADWLSGTPWSDAPRGLHSGIVFWAFGMAIGVTAAVWAISRLFRKDAPGIAMLGLPLNLGLVFGHMLDGFATFFAICSDATSTLCTGAAGFNLGLQGYGEKHPVSELFLRFGDGWGFPLMKLALILVIIYLIDRSAEEGDEDANLVGLVKLAVLILGLAPGTRDVLRVAMGV